MIAQGMSSDEVFPIFLLIGNDEMASCIGILHSLGAKSCSGVIFCLEILFASVFRNVRQIAFLFLYCGYLTVFCFSVGITGRGMGHRACNDLVAVLLSGYC